MSKNTHSNSGQMNKRDKDNRDMIRVNKYLSESGVCSRREADRLIADGKVLIDGHKAVPGEKVSASQKIEVAGKSVSQEQQFILIALNKPRGIVCTTDKREKQNVIDFLHFEQRIFPVGRLDKDSQGLLLLTNDGDLANQILKARHNHEKEYVVSVDKEITPQFIQAMSSGVPILDTVTRRCKVAKIGKCQFRIVLTQGLNRQIRRMCEHLGYRVTRLERVRIMNIQLGQLKTGQHRQVTGKELQTLKKLVKGGR